jgi:hypothetical protein
LFPTQNQFGIESVDSSSSNYIDWVRLRKIQTTEPVCTVAEVVINPTYFGLSSPISKGYLFATTTPQSVSANATFSVSLVAEEIEPDLQSVSANAAFSVSLSAVKQTQSFLPIRSAFYTNWLYKILITVVNPPTSTGYQVKAVVPWMPGMRDDFADLRFSDNYRTLPYWIESKTDRSTATVWIKLTEINEAAKGFYCYYGNGGAVSESSGTNTFSFFDDFDSFDSNNWTEEWSQGTKSYSNSVVTIAANYTPTPQTEILKTARDVLAVGTAVRYRVRPQHSGSSGAFELVEYRTGDCVGAAYCRYTAGRGGLTQLYYTGGTNYSAISGYPGAYTWFIQEIIHLSTSYKFTINDANTVTFNDTLGACTLGLYVAGGNSVIAQEEFDWFLERNVQATEPVCTLAIYGLNFGYVIAISSSSETYPITLNAVQHESHIDLTWSEP